MMIRAALPLAATAMLAAPASALAHSGHAAGAGSHWHATDSYGLLLVACAAALAWWFSRAGH